MKTENEVKSVLESLYTCDVPYTLVFSGKKSKNVNGLYKPDAKEIVLHNRNFDNDNQLIYTALHELSHHIVNAEMNLKQVHTTLFWSVFHDLLIKAEIAGLYVRDIKPELQAQIDAVKNLDSKIAELTSTLGTELCKLQLACKEQGVRFEDIVDRNICIKRSTVKKAEKIAVSSVPASIGQDAQAFVGMMKAEKADTALYLLGEGKSIDQVRQSFRETPDLTKLEAIEMEKEKIMKTMQRLSSRLAQLEDEAENISE